LVAIPYLENLIIIENEITNYSFHFQCNILRIDVDCTVANSWTEIDAIKIAGTKFNFGKYINSC
jgi:hypothetical protein